jgi:hypothetical protein
MRRIKTIRQLMVDQARNFVVEEYNVHRPDSTKEREMVVSKVLQLLIDEARLTPLLAADALGQALSKSPGEPPELPPFRAKEGLRAWLRRVAAHIPSSELLHHASSIRNSAAHIGQPDWPLRKRE